LNNSLENKNCIVNKPESPQGQGCSNKRRVFPLQLPSLCKLLKAGGNQAAKQRWTVTATLLCATPLVTPPHEIEQLKSQP
jgi:hypothetical protein